MEERRFIVYKHTSPNGKVYIGMTCLKPIQRWKKDGSGYKRNTHFWGAIQKYGWENFKHEILSAKEASDLLQIPRTSISANLNKRTKHARGFHFEFYKKRGMTYGKNLCGSQI